VLLTAILIGLFCLWLVWPAFQAKSPVWMGAADGFMLAKANFLAQGIGLGDWNGYWFLGIPGQHIGSSLLPFLLSLILKTREIDSISEVFVIWRSMVALGMVGIAALVFFLAGEIWDGFSKKRIETRKTRILFSGFVALFVLLFPSVVSLFPQIWNVAQEFGWPAWMIFSPFYLGDGNKTIGFMLILSGLIVGWRLVKTWDVKKAVYLSFLVGLVMLTDSLSLLPFILWLVVFVLGTVVVPGKRSYSVLMMAGRLLVVILLGVTLTSFWFTPGLVLTFLGSPSLGGRPFSLVAGSLVNRLLAFLPLVLGLVAAKRWLRSVNRAVVVGVVGILVFGGLSLASFLADPDFWQDYSRFGRSLDLSVALLIGGIVFSQFESYKKKSWVRLSAVILVLVLFSLPFLTRRSRLFAGDFDIEDTSEYRVSRNLSELYSECEESMKCGRAYLSGSSVFWLNSWFDVPQVRGGGNQGSLNDWWPHGSFQIREGMDVEVSGLWLDILGVSYLVVHGSDSSEVYHDFKYPRKFEKIEGWMKVWEEKGDFIYRKDQSSLARLVDLEILKTKSPEKGDDYAALETYVENLKGNAEFKWINGKTLEISGSVGENEGVRLAITYSPFWRVMESSVQVNVRQDALGMIVIEPVEEMKEEGSSRLDVEKGRLIVKLRFIPWLDLVIGALTTIIALFVLLKKPSFIEEVARRLHKSVGRETELDKSAL
jgi:hypothetical protein